MTYRGYQHRSYNPPGKNSDRAIAGARSFLTSARSLEDVTVVRLMNRYNLTPLVAEKELTDAKARRAAQPPLL